MTLVDYNVILGPMAKGRVLAFAENGVPITPPVNERRLLHNTIFLLHSENLCNNLNFRVANYCEVFGTEI